MAVIRVYRPGSATVFATIVDLKDVSVPDRERSGIPLDLEGYAFVCICSMVDTDRGHFEDTVRLAEAHVDRVGW